MDRRNLILGAAAAVILLVAVIYYATRPSQSAQFPREATSNCACLACKQPARVVARIVEPPPFECPNCGERAVYPLLRCRDCGAKFVPNLERRGDDEFPSLPIMPSCASCGSRNVGAYSTDEPIAADELILPQWP